MSKLNIAGLQLALDKNNQALDDNNFDQIQQQVDQALQRFPWIDLVVLSELVAYGVKQQYAQEQHGQAEQFYCQLARKHKIWMVAGSYLEKKASKIYNTTPIIDPLGRVIKRYRKIYPFLPYEKNISCGNEFVVFEIPNIGKLGVIICYDQWFPEVCRNLSWLGAEAIICPTLTNTIDRPMELVLAQANAVVNQCYFVNINSTGLNGYGKSAVFGPQGEVIYQANTGQELITVELDFNQVRHVRERGMHGLGQNLKSYRDNNIDFPAYQNKANKGAYAKLGKLNIPQSRLKLD